MNEFALCVCVCVCVGGGNILWRTEQSMNACKNDESLIMLRMLEKSFAVFYIYR